jgi:predicted Fe-S protein YdhL (DUF1289 family)
VRECALDASRAWCLGCHRTIDEIVEWRTMSATEQWSVVSALPVRRAQRQADTGASSAGCEVLAEMPSHGNHSC